MTSATILYTAVRGQLIYFRQDPFLVDPKEAFVFERDGLLLVKNGIIENVGSYEQLKSQIPAGVEVKHHPDCLISPGFIDTHVHYPQAEIIGAFGRQLLDWLNEYTFIAEQKYADKNYADKKAEFFCNELVKNGTTTALVFCTVYSQSVDALFEQAEKINMRIIAGKVLMDRNAPQALLDTAKSGYEDSKKLIKRWHGKGRNLYAITPRFAPTSSNEQLELAGALWKEHPEVHVQTHVSENLKEIDWVKSLFPEAKGYLDVYDRFGLLGKRSLMAHGVHLTEEELCRCHESDTSISHCPTSNLFLGSGLFKVHKAKDPKRPVKVGMGTDIGAGTSFSLLQTMNESYKVAQLNEFPLDAIKAFYLATLGGAQALHLEDKIGTFKPGHEADFIVMDPNATELLKMRSSHAKSIEEQMFILMTIGDDRCIKATYVAGKEVYKAQV